MVRMTIKTIIFLGGFTLAMLGIAAGQVDGRSLAGLFLMCLAAWGYLPKTWEAKR